MPAEGEAAIHAAEAQHMPGGPFSKASQEASAAREKREEESVELRVTRLLGEAYAEADAGNHEGAIGMATAAIDDWNKRGDS